MPSMKGILNLVSCLCVCFFFLLKIPRKNSELPETNDARGTKPHDRTVGFKTKNPFVKKPKNDPVTPPNSPPQDGFTSPLFGASGKAFTSDSVNSGVKGFSSSNPENNAPDERHTPLSSSPALFPLLRQERGCGESLFHAPKEMCPSPPSSPPPNMDSTREMVRAKGAQGFLSRSSITTSNVVMQSFSHQSPLELSPISSPQKLSSKLSPTNIDNTREMVRAKGAVGFLSQTPASPSSPQSPSLKFSSPKGAQSSNVVLPFSCPSPFELSPTSSPQKLSPRNIDSTREMVCANGAKGFLSQSPTNADEIGGCGLSPPYIDRFERPPSAGCPLYSPLPSIGSWSDSPGIEDTRKMVRAKGAQGFLACVSDFEDFPIIHHDDQAKWSPGSHCSSPPCSPNSPLEKSKRDDLFSTGSGDLPFSSHLCGALSPTFPQSEIDSTREMVRAKGAQGFLSSPPQIPSLGFPSPTNSHNPDQPNIAVPKKSLVGSGPWDSPSPTLSPSQSGIDGTREMVRAKGAQGFLNLPDQPPKEDLTPISPPLCGDVHHPPQSISPYIKSQGVPHSNLSSSPPNSSSPSTTHKKKKALSHSHLGEQGDWADRTDVSSVASPQLYSLSLSLHNLSLPVDTASGSPLQQRLLPDDEDTPKERRQSKRAKRSSFKLSRAKAKPLKNEGASYGGDSGKSALASIRLSFSPPTISPPTSPPISPPISPSPSPPISPATSLLPSPPSSPPCSPLLIEGTSPPTSPQKSQPLSTLSPSSSPYFPSKKKELE